MRTLIAWIERWRVVAFKARERKAQLDELERRFEERLAVLQQPEARTRLDAMLAARGKLANGKPPIAAESC